MWIERMNRDGLSFGEVWDLIAVAETLGMQDNVSIRGKTEQDGRLVTLRVGDGDDMSESSSFNKDGASPAQSESDRGQDLHKALSHDGQFETCPNAACRQIRRGREDKTHPAGQEPQ